MTPAEQDAALRNVLEFIAPTDDEIAAEIDAMSDEDLDAGLRADGIDPEAWAAEVRARIAAFMRPPRLGRKRTRRLWRKRGRR